MSLFFGKKTAAKPQAAAPAAPLPPYEFKAKTWGQYEKTLTTFLKRKPYFQVSDEDFLKKTKPGRTVYQFARTETAVQLVPEPTNRVDQRAIQVVINDNPVGYVPASALDVVWQYITRYHNATASIYGGPWKRNDDGLVEVGKADYTIMVEVTEVPVCPSCGSPVTGNFCGHCGAKL